MEPPAKRPRLGISSFNNDDEDDADGDELNLAPEQVNALRDPGYQLERSRAHAANRLKSAWERIFEKYEKDFTGIGDEIDLETGQVVVDNGHIQSLQYTEIGGEGGDEDDQEDEDDDESIDEEERLLQGKSSKERRLSTVGEDQNSALTSLVRPLAPLGQPQPWSGMQWGTGGPPRISSMFGPPNPFGSFSAPFNIPAGMETLVDSAWKAPELPVVETYVEPAWRAPELPPPKPPGPRITTVKKKLLPARSGHVDGGREQDEDEDEDDILMGSSTTPMTRPNGGVTVKKMNMLLPPNSAQGTPSGSRGIVSKPKSTPKPKGDNSLKPKESTRKRKVAPKNLNKDTLTKPSPKSGPSPKSCTHMKENQRPQTHHSPVPNKQVVAVKSKKSKEMLPAQQREAATEKPDVEMYINHSSPDKPLTAKPANQKLSVEIIVQQKIDTALYQVVEDLVDDLQIESVNQQQFDGPAKTDVTIEDMGKKKRPRLSTVEKAFSRNVIDSSYGFSDDEEPALPKPRKRRKLPPSCKETTKQHGVLNSSCSQEPAVEGVSAKNGVDLTLEHSAVFEEAREEDTSVRNENRDDPTDQDVPKKSEPQERVVEEVYTRNVVDPSFDFSDEDEASLPKARIRGGSKLAREKSNNAVEKEVAEDKAVLTAVEVPSPSSIDLKDGQQGVPEGNVEEQPVHDANDGLREQEPVTGDLLILRDSSKPPNQEGDNNVVSGVDCMNPLALVESSGILSTFEASPKISELPTDKDTTARLDSTLPIDGSEPTVTGPIDLGEGYPIRLLSMKPRRKRKISTAFTEDSLASPAVTDEEKPKETYISAPVKRFKKLKQTHPIQVTDQDVGSQPEEQTVQVQPEPELLAGNDSTLQEANPTSPAIQESPQPAATAPVEVETTAVDVELTIPESPPLIQPAFRSSLLGIVDEEDLSTLAQLDDAETEADANPDPENDMDISIDLGLDFDSPPSGHHDHNPHPTPLPDLPSPELGEQDQDLNPETSPLPYSSPSKAVKAVKVRKVPNNNTKPGKTPQPQPQPQPSTPSSKKRGRPKKQQQQANSKPPQTSSATPAHPPPSSALSARTKGLLSLVSDDEASDDDELSLTPGARPRYYTTPPNNVRGTGTGTADKLKHTSLTAPLMRMKLLDSSKKEKGIVNNPRTPSSGRRKTLTSTVPVNDNDENQKPRGGRGILPSSSVASSKMYFSADRRPSTAASSSSGAVVTNNSSGGGASLRSRGGIAKRRRRSAAGGGSRLAANPAVPEYVDDDSVAVETPGGTQRRCGEDGFHCDRDFCFVCL